MLKIRKANLTDVPALLGLINDYAARGVMLPRTEFELCENLRDFTVAIETNSGDEQLAGCGALHFYTMQTAEIRSLAVAERRKTSGSKPYPAAKLAKALPRMPPPTITKLKSLIVDMASIFSYLIK